MKYLGNFWRSLEILLINCKIKLNFKWSNYCVLSAGGNNNANSNDDNIIFTIKDAKLYVPVLAEDLNGQFIGMSKIKKVKIKVQQMSIDILSNEILLELINCLF